MVNQLELEINKKKFVPVILIIILLILITVFSVYHTQHLGKAYLQYPLFLYGTNILSLLIGGYVVYIYGSRLDNGKFKRLISVLPVDERKVFKLIMGRKEIEQSKIGSLTGLSTVKVSRIIRDFETKGVVEKKKHGYTNLIVLKI